MSTLVVDDDDDTITKLESSKDLHYFIAFIIPFLPFVDDKEDDDDKLTEDDILSIQSHPTYVMNKRLFGTELEGNQEYVINFDDMVMRMIHIYLKKIKIHEDDSEIGGKKGGRKKGGRKKVGGGGFEEILKDKKKMFAMLQFVFGIFLLYIGISKFIDVQNRTLVSTSTPAKPPSTSDMGTALTSTDDMGTALTSTDDMGTALTWALSGTGEIGMDKQIMFPEMNLAKEVNQQITSITVKEFVKAALGYKTEIYANSLIIFENEATEQATRLYKKILEINLPIIQKDAAEKFLSARGATAIVLKEGDAEEIKQEIFNQINQMSLTDRIFNYYKFSFTGSFSDIVRATKSAVRNFKIEVQAKLDIKKDDALFKAESFILDAIREGVTSIQVIFVGLTLLATAYGTFKAKSSFPQDWDNLTLEEKEMWRKRLERLLDNKGPPPDYTAITRSQGAVLMPGVEGGRKIRRKKTRKKGRKTRRKSKKRKTKRRKRKTKRRRKRRR
jgi:hypothetical protein